MTSMANRKRPNNKRSSVPSPASIASVSTEDDDLPSSLSPRYGRKKSEHKRRVTINQYYDELIALLSMISEHSVPKKMDKVTTLKEAVSCIRLYYDLTQQPLPQQPLPQQPDLTSQEERAKSLKSPPIANTAPAGYKNVPPELLSNGELLSFFLDTHDSFLIVVSSSGRIIFSTSLVTSLLGYMQSRLIGQDIYQFTHEKDRALIQSLFTPLEGAEGVSSPASPVVAYPSRSFSALFQLYTGETSCFPQYLPFTCLSFLRQWKPFEDSSSKTGADKGRSCVVIIGKLPTSLILVDLAIGTNDVNFEFEMRISREGHIIDVDKHAILVLGFSLAELLGTSFFEYIDPYHIFEVGEVMSKFLTNGLGTITPYRIRTKGGRYIWLVSKGYISYNPWNNKLDHILLSNRVLGCDQVLPEHRFFKSRRHMPDMEMEEQYTIPTDKMATPSSPPPPPPPPLPPPFTSSPLTNTTLMEGGCPKPAYPTRNTAPAPPTRNNTPPDILDARDPHPPPHPPHPPPSWPRSMCSHASQRDGLTTQMEARKAGRVEVSVMAAGGTSIPGAGGGGRGGGRGQGSLERNESRSDQIEALTAHHETSQGHHESGRYESGRHESGRHESGRHESGHHEPGHHEPGHHDSSANLQRELEEKTLKLVEMQKKLMEQEQQFNNDRVQFFKAAQQMMVHFSRVPGMEGGGGGMLGGGGMFPSLNPLSSSSDTLLDTYMDTTTSFTPPPDSSSSTTNPHRRHDYTTTTTSGGQRGGGYSWRQPISLSTESPCYQHRDATVSSPLAPSQPPPPSHGAASAPCTPSSNHIFNDASSFPGGAMDSDSFFRISQSRPTEGPGGPGELGSGGFQQPYQKHGDLSEHNVQFFQQQQQCQQQQQQLQQQAFYRSLSSQNEDLLGTGTSPSPGPTSRPNNETHSIWGGTNSAVLLGEDSYI